MFAMKLAQANHPFLPPVVMFHHPIGALGLVKMSFLAQHVRRKLASLPVCKLET